MSLQMTFNFQPGTSAKEMAVALRVSADALEGKKDGEAVPQGHASPKRGPGRPPKPKTAKPATDELDDGLEASGGDADDQAADDDLDGDDAETDEFEDGEDEDTEEEEAPAPKQTKGKSYTLQDVIAACRDAAKVTSKDEVKAVLAKHGKGAKSPTTMDPKYYPAVMKALTA